MALKVPRAPTARNTRNTRDTRNTRETCEIRKARQRMALPDYQLSNDAGKVTVYLLHGIYGAKE